MKNIIPLILIFLFVINVGCMQSVRYSEEEIKNFPPDIQEHIRKGEITLGMTPSQVRFSWGPPNSLRVLEPSEDGKNRDEWVYKNLGGILQTRIIFTDGRITEIITNDPQVKK